MPLAQRFSSLPSLMLVVMLALIVFLFLTAVQAGDSKDDSKPDPSPPSEERFGPPVL